MASDPQYFRDRYISNRDAILAASKRRSAERTPDEAARRRQYNRDWYARNREAERQKQGAKRASATDAEREHRKAQRREYYIKNRDRIITEVRQYNADHPTAKKHGRIRSYEIELAQYER